MNDRIRAIGRSLGGLFTPPPPRHDGEVWKARFDVLARGSTPQQVQASERVIEIAEQLARRTPLTFPESVRLVLAAIAALDRYSDVDLERIFGLDTA